MNNTKNKKLFNEDERYTKNGGILDSELYEALFPIFKKWIAKGFKIQDIEYVAKLTCTDIALERLLVGKDE